MTIDTRKGLAFLLNNLSSEDKARQVNISEDTLLIKQIGKYGELAEEADQRNSEVFVQFRTTERIPAAAQTVSDCRQSANHFQYSISFSSSKGTTKILNGMK